MSPRRLAPKVLAKSNEYLEKNPYVLFPTLQICVSIPSPCQQVFVGLYTDISTNLWSHPKICGVNLPGSTDLRMNTCFRLYL